MLLRKLAIFKPLGAYGFLICIGFLVDLALYGTLLVAGVDVYIAFVASFAVGTVCNVMLLRRYFRSGRHSLRTDLAMTFASNGAMLLGGFMLYAALMVYAAMPAIVAKIVSNGVTFVANYAIRRRFF